MLEHQVALNKTLTRIFIMKKKLFYKTYKKWEILHIYEHIFKTDLSRFRSVILFSLQNIIAGSEANRDFIIHTASEDYLYLVEKRELIMEMVSGSSTVEIIKDLTLSQGQCMVETGGGIFDCSIDTQLDGLAKELRLLSFDKKK